MVSMTGCSELQIISSAALSEVQAEAINVEWRGYENDKKPETKKGEKIMVAKKASNGGFLLDNNRMASNQKGLWEGKN